jgi:hypothetical protein
MCCDWVRAPAQLSTVFIAVIYCGPVHCIALTRQAKALHSMPLWLHLIICARNGAHSPGFERESTYPVRLLRAPHDQPHAFGTVLLMNCTCSTTKDMQDGKHMIARGKPGSHRVGPRRLYLHGFYDPFPRRYQLEQLDRAP